MSDSRFDMTKRDICQRLDGIIEAIRDGRNKPEGDQQISSKAVSEICSRLDDIRDVIGYAGNVMGDERDAMAWQLFLALRQAGSDWQWSNDAKFAYDGTDAFLAERKRQQGEA